MAHHEEPGRSFPFQPVPLADLENAESGSVKQLAFLLAVKFNYDVRQGGFSQLIYNLQGNFRAETEDMLIAAKAAVAQEYFVRAVMICLNAKEEYFRFLSSPYTDANNVKHSLQLLSVDYFQRQIDFQDEAAEFLLNRPRP